MHHEFIMRLYTENIKQKRKKKLVRQKWLKFLQRAFNKILLKAMICNFISK